MEQVVLWNRYDLVGAFRLRPDGSAAATELDRQAETFVHEIEIGDLDGDALFCEHDSHPVTLRTSC